MGIRTGAELIAGLEDGRELYIDGERVADLAGDPRFAGGLRTLADLYDMQHEDGLDGRDDLCLAELGRTGRALLHPAPEPPTTSPGGG